jgi:DNA polymerase III subunit epsilon
MSARKPQIATEPVEALQIPDTEFVVCDIETTGLSAQNNRMTEIALRRVVNGKIVDRYESLINPHQFVSVEIQKLTGISNEMVYSAPELGDVMEEVLEFLGDAVFVAHNARFDRSFVDAALERIGLPAIENPTLCTVRLAHRLLPKRTKANLGNLARSMGVSVSNRHRAAGDAEATAKILLRFLEVLRDEFNFNESGEILTFQNKPVYRITSPPKNVLKLRDRLAELPHSSGVYFFHDKFGNVIYIGKAKNLRDRVNSYFYHNIGHTEKVKKLVHAVRSITWQTTETELSALLLESRSIKQHQPRFNTLLKGYRKYPFIKIDTANEYPRILWSYEMEDDGADYYGPFSSRFAVEDAIDSINKLFRLRECDGNIHPDADSSACLYYDIKRCSAPCADLISNNEYLQEVNSLRMFLNGNHEQMLGVFKERMEQKSQQLQFEEAAVLRDRMAALERIIRQQKVMARSVQKQNLVIVTLARGSNVELHVIKSGMLAFQMLVDQKKVNRTQIANSLETVLYSKQAEIFGNAKEDINEMRIIASWCLTRRDDSTVVDTDEYKSPEELLYALFDVIKSAGQPDVCEESVPAKAAG